MAVWALTEGYAMFGDTSYEAAAEKGETFILRRMHQHELTHNLSDWNETSANIPALSIQTARDFVKVTGITSLYDNYYDRTYFLNSEANKWITAIGNQQIDSSKIYTDGAWHNGSGRDDIHMQYMGWTTSFYALYGGEPTKIDKAKTWFENMDAYVSDGEVADWVDYSVVLPYNMNTIGEINFLMAGVSVRNVSGYPNNFRTVRDHVKDNVTTENFPHYYDDWQITNAIAIDAGMVGTSNNPPSLSNGSVTPSSGDTSTIFTYTVTYTDADNDPPTEKYVLIDGCWHNMSTADTTYTDGSVFTYSTTLSEGEYDYYFLFNDGTDSVRDPPIGVHHGPNVSSSPETIYVDDDFADDPANHTWNTIQEGINDANDGDTVIVYSGTYNEHVNVNKQLNLTGIGMPVVDAGGSGSAITLSADGITLVGFRATNSGSSGGNAGIKVTSDNNAITGNTASNNYRGIRLDSSSSNNITGNTASSNIWNGIRLGSSSSNNITGNTASNNKYGIYLDYSSSNNITGNTVSNNKYGIFWDFSNNNTLTSNTANSNSQFGICLGYSSSNNITGNTVNNNIWGGIILGSSSSNNITGNTVSNNNDDGIWLGNSCNNIITGNTVINNNDDGIGLYGSSSNTIYNNYFNNTNNAYNDPYGNIWNITKTSGMNIIGGPYLGGNYWSDYAGEDLDGDGLGDTPYGISYYKYFDNVTFNKLYITHTSTAKHVY